MTLRHKILDFFYEKLPINSQKIENDKGILIIFISK